MIIISSIAGYNPEQGLTMYGVTKTALLGLTKVYVHLLFFVIFHFVCYMMGVRTMGTPRKAPLGPSRTGRAAQQGKVQQQATAAVGACWTSCGPIPRPAT